MNVISCAIDLVESNRQQVTFVEYMFFRGYLIRDPAMKKLTERQKQSVYAPGAGSRGESADPVLRRSAVALIAFRERSAVAVQRR